jgi:NADPH:quinone reductase-like Zn-dependent oxidoreductase
MRQLPVINLVRKEEHIKELSEAGERHVLNLGNPECEINLRKLALENNATIAFDAVAGDTSGMILNAMPPGSELIVYGGLSGKPVGMLLPLDIIFKAKTIRGFNLGDWKTSVGEEYFQKVSVELQDLMIRRVLLTRIQGVFSLEEVQLAMEQYIRNMSSGKILFQP